MSTDHAIDEVVYRQIPDAPGHKFGSDGIAWSCHTHGHTALCEEWKLQKGHIGGSKIKWLYIRIDDRRVHVRLDEAFCWAFRGPRPSGTECIHRDGDRENNRPDNLYWGSLPENVRDESLEYRTLDGFDGYLFCENGSIWTFWSIGRIGQTDVCKRMKFTTLSSRYLQVSLKYKGEPEKRFGVHRLICMAFNGPPDRGDVARHLDGNRQNNCAANLAWGTHRDNVDDAIRCKSLLYGEKHPHSKLTQEDVARIRDDYKNGGITITQMARRHNVSGSTIYGIIKGETWKHTYKEPDAQNDFEKMSTIYTAESYPSSTDFIPIKTEGAWCVQGNSDRNAAIFIGDSSELRAREYAQWKNSQGIKPRNETPPINAKFTEDQVKALRLEYETGSITVADLARRFGIKNFSMARMLCGDTWSHVPGAVKLRERERKLTENDIREIRRLYEDEGISKQELAVQYDVTAVTISNVVNRKTSKHVV